MSCWFVCELTVVYLLINGFYCNWLHMYHTYPIKIIVHVLGIAVHVLEITILTISTFLFSVRFWKCSDSVAFFFFIFFFLDKFSEIFFLSNFIVYMSFDYHHVYTFLLKKTTMVTKYKLGTLKSCESKTQYLLDDPCSISAVVHLRYFRCCNNCMVTVAILIQDYIKLYNFDNPTQNVFVLFYFILLYFTYPNVSVDFIWISVSHIQFFYIPRLLLLLRHFIF